MRDAAGFDRVIAVDWSARSAPSPARWSKDAIWVCEGVGATILHPVQHRTRDQAMTALTAKLDDALPRGERVILGFDFAYGYPTGVARRLTGRDSALAVWDWLADRVVDAPDNRNNRFEVAAEMNRHFPGVGPFWGAPGGRDRSDLPARATSRRDWGNTPEHRETERAPRAKSAFQIMYAGAVGSQTLLGLPRLAALRRRYGGDLAVWPLETGWTMPRAPLVLVEIYPGLWRDDDLVPLIARHPDQPYRIPDARQVRAVVERIAGLGRSELGRAFREPAGLAHPARVATEEGWIFGHGAGDAHR